MEGGTAGEPCLYIREIKDETMVEHGLKWCLAPVGQDKAHQPGNEPDKIHWPALTCSQCRLKHWPLHTHGQNHPLNISAGKAEADWFPEGHPLAQAGTSFGVCSGGGENSCAFRHEKPPTCGYFPLPLKPKEADCKGLAFPPQ